MSNPSPPSPLCGLARRRAGEINIPCHSPANQNQIYLQLFFQQPASEALRDPATQAFYHKLTLVELTDRPNQDVRRNDEFRRILDLVVKRLNVSMEELPRFEFLLAAMTKEAGRHHDLGWITSPVFDLLWATDNHMRLISLTADERQVLEQVWRADAGSVSISNMLCKAFPEKKFSEPETCANQLLTLEAERIQSAISALYGRRDPGMVLDRVREEIEAIKRLRRHLQFSIKSGGQFDKKAFDGVYNIWINFIDSSPASYLNAGESIILAQFSQERFEFDLELTDLFSLGECYIEGTSGLTEKLNRHPRDGDRKEIKAHIKVLRERVMRRVSKGVVEMFKSGAIPAEWPPPDFPNRTNIQFFCYPENWLLRGDGIDLEPLQELADLAQTSKQIAESFGELTYSLFLHPVACNICAGNHVDEQRVISSLGERIPEYLRLFWKAARSPAVSAELAERLFEERRRAYEGVQGQHFIDTNILDQCFSVT